MSIIDKINNILTIDTILTFIPDLKKNGHNYVGKCPTGHGSKSGTSFQINTIDPTFHCWNCGVHGSYIHLVELVKFGISSCGKGGTDTFKDTLKLLADQFSLNDTAPDYDRYEAVFDIIDWAISDYQEQLFGKSSTLVPAILEKYGLNEDFVKRERWGYGAQCPSARMSEYWNANELLSTGLFNKSPRNKSGVFHIYQTRIVIPYNDRGRARYSIGRKTKHTKNWPDGKEAPKYFKQYIHREKRPYVSPAIKNQIVNCNRDYDDIIITEGITDYLAAKMHELNAVSAVTTSFKKEEYEKVVAFCKKFKSVFIANDNDENEAGQKGTKRICEMLIDAGINPFIVLLPRGDGQSKIDLSEFLRDKGVDAFLALKTESVSYIDFLINEIPEDIDRSKLIDKLLPVMQMLAKQSKEVAEIYIMDKIKPRFKLSSMKELLKKITKNINDLRINETEAQLEIKEGVDVFNSSGVDIDVISSGQDYKYGKLYYTVTIPYTVTDKLGVTRVINKIFVVSSDKKIQEVKDYQVLTKSLVLNRKLSPGFKCEPWTFKGTKYSVENFVKGNVKINPGELYKGIKSVVNRYIHLKKDHDACFVAVAHMVSSVVMIFDTIGYIHLWAEMRSGKSTLLDIFSLIGFNAKLSSSMSDAAIYRSIETSRPLLLMDEAENLNPSARSRETNPSEKLELLKSGYKKGGSATRCEGQSNMVVQYSNYCMKIFAGTKLLDAVLADRAIMLEMKRAKEGVELEELIGIKIKEEALDLKDQVCCLGMTFATELEDIYMNQLDNFKDILKAHKVTFRYKEIWAAYLTMAILIDKYEPGLNVFDSLLEKALLTIETKEMFGGDSKSMEIVERLYLWMKKVKAGDVFEMNLYYDGDIYMRKGLTDSFIKTVLRSDENEDDFKYVNYQNLKQMLRKFDVIDKDCEYKKHSIGSRTAAALLLDQDRVLESIMTYKNDFEGEILDDIRDYKERKGEQVKDRFNFEEMGVD